MTALRRPALLFALLASVLAPGARAEDPGEPFDERRENVFFRQPDRDTRNEIELLIGSMASDSVIDRFRRRARLREIGYWAVEPLLTALDDLDPPRQCAASLTLEAIGDHRAPERLRAATVRERTHPFVSGFSALALGRYRDPGALGAFGEATADSKSGPILRSAVALALARIGTPKAKQRLLEEIRGRGERPRFVQMAQFIALGFFPDEAIEGDGPAPSAVLREGLGSDDRFVREAAILGYLVATAGRADTQDELFKLLETEDRVQPRVAILIGLSRYPGQDVTRLLAEVAAKRGKIVARTIAADLLANRGDEVALPALRKIVRTTGEDRLRAAAVLAISAIDHEDASHVVLQRIGDDQPMVRAAAAVGCVRLKDADARARAVARITGRLRQTGERSRQVRENLELARAVLTGERADVRWVSLERDRLFENLSLGYEDWMLALVNLRTEDSLDLGKITNLTTDSELVPDGPLSNATSPGTTGNDAEADGPDGPENGGNLGDEGGDEGGGDEGGDDEPGFVPGVDPTPDGGVTPPTGGRPGSVPVPGSARVNDHQELRDLKVRLRRAPYFGLADLPGRRRAPATDE